MALAERRGSRRGLAVGAVVLVFAALGMLAYPVFTDFCHNSLHNPDVEGNPLVGGPSAPAVRSGCWPSGSWPSPRRPTFCT